LGQAEAYEAAGFKKDARDFSSASKILKSLDVKSIRMLTHNSEKTKIMTQFGIEVTGTREITL
jgi:GTP cyclohydrolase II